ncbi:phosphoribosylglycinamide formyltransferase [Thiococcus pfennigii]|uniref:phosphoribosylglycinamide formyltransferase n=1 Tax=Thiococcus pfennigii TaxID=1057 RepID=UPI00190624A2|nr:phosphoribosylglycinamide formyltransferase [Thiococcus pfennigii]MBK1702632.1 phosphoribosylglycinamide formyltransferase [Thiococcus pfennigii]
MTAPEPARCIVLISGGGTNLQALIDAERDGLPVRIAAVISNEPQAYGLVRARAAGIATRVLSHRGCASRDDYDRALARLIDEFRPTILLLAGFMRILTPRFVAHYRGRLLNIHPSLLPDLRGLHTHRRALESGARVHGASVHFVTDELDGGPVIVQARVPVLPGDQPETLAARVLQREHLIYPLAVRWLAEGRLTLGDDGLPRLDGQILDRPRLLEDEEAPTEGR